MTAITPHRNRSIAASFLSSPHLLLIVCLIIVIHVAQSTPTPFSIRLFPQQQKCLSEHIRRHTLYKAELRDMVALDETQTHPAQTNGLIFTVYDEDSIVYSDKDHHIFQTAFTTSHAGIHTVCVENSSTQPHTVKIGISWGADAKDYTELAKKAHLDDTVTTLHYVEDLLKSYHRGVLFLRSREARLRSTNESISFRLLLFCAISVTVVVSAAALQTLYFRSFFRSRKII